MEQKKYKGELILLRGIPGSGKSTVGSVILHSPTNTNPEILSADDFFYNEKGEYIFDPTKIKEAHNQCQFRCSERMRQESNKIVVANTFTEEWEMEPYFEMAQRYGYRVHSLVVENRHSGKNIHNVPEEKVTQMRDRFEVKL